MAGESVDGYWVKRGVIQAMHFHAVGRLKHRPTAITQANTRVPTIHRKRLMIDRCALSPSQTITHYAS